MNATGSYIPDHIRLCRTDRLVHIQESLQLVMRRYLLDYWTSQKDADRVKRLHLELTLIGAELHKRHMRVDKAHRAARQARYQADWR